MIRRLVFLLFVLLIVAITAAAVYLLVPLVGDLTGKSLAHSVARETETKGKLDKASCRKQAKKRFICRVPAGKGKPVVKYRVRMEDRRCWQARRASGGSGKPPTKKGCVGLRDQLRLGPLEEIL